MTADPDPKPKPLRPQNAHLVPFKPGQSGNPHGRAKGEVYISEAVRMLARGEAPPDSAAPVWRIAANVIRCLEAERLDSRLLSLVLDRLEGKVPDRLELNASAGVVLLPASRLEGAEWSLLARETMKRHAIEAEVVAEPRPARELAPGEGEDGEK